MKLQELNTEETTPAFPFPLTANQKQVVDIVLNTNDNIFVLGKPGVGKSVLINYLEQECYEYKIFTLAAPTGLAAVNINGKTLHSIFRIPVFQGIIPPDYNIFTTDEKTINYIRFGIKYLIIDEISMVRADVLDYLDRLLQYVMGKSLPFGGKQVICFGDFFQLSPVTTAEDKKQFNDAGYESPYAFSAFVYKSANFKPILLNEVLRQKGDVKFLQLLDRARYGQVTAKDCALLKKQVGQVDDFRIRLCMVNRQADEVNMRELDKIKSPTVYLKATEYGDWKDTPVEREIQLKIGAQVLVKKNKADRPPVNRNGGLALTGFVSKVVNGTLGKVVAINMDQPKEDSTEYFIPHIKVELPNGDQVNIYKARWERKRKFKNIDGDWEEEVVASYEQFPLALAWAISAHKSQGQTFDKVHIDPSKVFADGQMYVALSRCRTLAGISFESPVKSRHFKTSRTVLRYFQDVEENL